MHSYLPWRQPEIEHFQIVAIRQTRVFPSAIEDIVIHYLLSMYEHDCSQLIANLGKFTRINDQLDYIFCCCRWRIYPTSIYRPIFHPKIILAAIKTFDFQELEAPHVFNINEMHPPIPLPSLRD